jgi:D-sedoheptulose 7-phosphate isomerase
MSEFLRSGESVRVEDARARRHAPGMHLADRAAAVSAACRDMARRFHDGGKLVAFGEGRAAADAQHVAVEFIHPVIVGKRALPALSLADDVATVTGLASTAGLSEVFAHQVARLAEPADITLGIASVDSPAVRRGLDAARGRGCLTVALVGEDVEDVTRDIGIDHVLAVADGDARVARELQVTVYHVLWELVHVFLEHPAALAAEATATTSRLPTFSREPGSGPGSHDENRLGEPGAPPSCHDEVCITCADAAEAAEVVDLLPGDMARVATTAGVEEISVALVHAAVGQTVLVHAREAIGVVE